MKRQLSHKIFSCLLVLLPAGSSFAQTKVVSHPAYLTGGIGLGSNSGLERVEFYKDSTILVASLYDIYGRNPIKQGTLQKPIWLTTGRDSLPLLSAVAYSSTWTEDSARVLAMGEKFTYHRHDSLRLVFPPLPKKAETFDFNGQKERGADLINGIRTDGKSYSSLIQPEGLPRLQGTLPAWQHCYAPAVIRGKVHGWPTNRKFFPSYWGNRNNIKQDASPEVTSDSLGNFNIRRNLAYPLTFGMGVTSCSVGLVLCPGDTIDIDYDLQTASQYQYEDKDLQQKLTANALHVKGGLSGLLGCDQLIGEYMPSGWSKERIDTVHAMTYAEFREWQWKEHLNRLATFKTLSLSSGEMEYAQMQSEDFYMGNCKLYPTLCSWRESVDSATMARPERQVTLVDPHAQELIFPHTLNWAYVNTDTVTLAYLRDNGLTETPVGKWLTELMCANEIVARVKAAQAVSDSELSMLSQEFLQPIHEIRAQLAPKEDADQAWTPQGSPDTYIQQIVKRHPGKVVFIDFWATWCGPCRMGISEMEKVKSSLEQKGVDFVYITDNTSTTEGYLEMKSSHHGDHYIFTKEDWKKMNIPGYDNSIPHYLIYGRNGQLIKSISGWIGLEQMTKELNDALKE